MKRILLLILYALSPFYMMAQQYAEYNRKGDDAMEREDYRDARMYYGEGLEYCDMYSIQGLTRIWLINESMRSSMRSLMAKCLSCLNDKAIANDTTAISRLIVYYTEGIGTPHSEEQVRHWTNQLELLRTPPAAVQYPVQPVTREKKPRQKMHFLMGYALSLESPYGLTLGGLWDKAGWYARFKTNLSFDKYTYTFNQYPDQSVGFPFLPDGKTVRVSSNAPKRVNSYAGTAGFIYQVTSWLYASVGAGYGKRALMYQFLFTDNATSLNEAVWCKHLDSSYKGVVVEAEGMLRYKSVFLSAGCHTMNFKYVDLNAGIGLIF
jgi:hypothetical protein